MVNTAYTKTARLISLVHGKYFDAHIVAKGISVQVG